MKRLILNIFTTIASLSATFSGFALVVSMKHHEALGFTTFFWLYFHITAGSTAIFLLVAQAIVNRARIIETCKKIVRVFGRENKIGFVTPNKKSLRY